MYEGREILYGTEIALDDKVKHDNDSECSQSTVKCQIPDEDGSLPLIPVVEVSSIKEIQVIDFQYRMTI